MGAAHELQPIRLRVGDESIGTFAQNPRNL